MPDIKHVSRTPKLESTQYVANWNKVDTTVTSPIQILVGTLLFNHSAESSIAREEHMASSPNR